MEKKAFSLRQCSKSTVAKAPRLLGSAGAAFLAFIELCARWPMEGFGFTGGPVAGPFNGAAGPFSSNATAGSMFGGAAVQTPQVNQTFAGQNPDQALAAPVAPTVPVAPAGVAATPAHPRDPQLASLSEAFGKPAPSGSTWYEQFVSVAEQLPHAMVIVDMTRTSPRTSYNW